jgi:hypothetical protein
VKARDELQPEIYPLDLSADLPAEVSGDHPYLDAVKAHGLLGDERQIGDVWPPELDDAELASDKPVQHELFRRHINRQHLRRTYSWAIPNDAALEALARLSPLLELGAGGGYWASLLRQRDVDIVAVDRNPPPAEGRTKGWAWRLWTEVERGELEVLERYPERTLVLCWPSPGVDDDCWAAEVLRRSRQRTLVFIGEARGGCTGSEAFHQLLDDRYQLEREIVIPRWSFTHDQLWIYRRRAYPRRTS